MVSCRVFGHRFRFSTEAEVMRWECERGCGAQGSKRYASAEQAARYARAFDREDRDTVGHRPLLSMLPLRMAQKLAERRRDAPR